jgi:hypothetical protein
MKTLNHFQKAVLFILVLSPISSILGQEPIIYDYLRTFKDKEAIEKINKDSDKQILIVGTFHFGNKDFKVEPIRDEILKFEPEMIFLEEVPPGQDKEKYKDELYANPKRGDRFYSQFLDSASAFSDISKNEALTIIRDLTSNAGSFDINERIKLINALFIHSDDPNALLQLGYLKQAVIAQELPDSLKSLISPYHQKYRFSMGETRHLAIPIALELGLSRIESMDYQLNRTENDSLLSITTNKIVPRLALKVWKLPYMIKMMNLDKNGPENEKEAIRHFKILNSWKTMLNMAKVHEKYFNNDKVPESVIWNQSYRTRNEEMVKLIEEKATPSNAKRIVIIVGASHVPYFIYEIQKQMPAYRITFLNSETY